MGSLKYQVLPIIRVSPTFKARQIFQVTHNFRYTNHDMVCRAFDSKLIWLTSSKKEVTPESTLHNVPVNTRNTKPEPARLPDFFSLPDSLLKTQPADICLLLLCYLVLVTFAFATANLAFVWMCYKGCKSYYT